ncbi:MAG TPA: 30S ribosomal protein S7 [Firmicutes bacterium]|nr:30S ribosomal protein S7 [Bacillota bacterium]
MRGRKPKKRIVVPDAVYNNTNVTRFVNKLMWRGKKTVAESIFYGALDYIKQKTGDEGIEVFHKALENARPHVQVRSRRVGGSTYQVPIDIKPDKQVEHAMRWLIHYSRIRKGRPMRIKLAMELMDAASGTGATVKKKDDTHRMAESNRAFAHYRV